MAGIARFYVRLQHLKTREVAAKLVLGWAYQYPALDGRGAC
jgi:hypothetical protein